MQSDAILVPLRASEHSYDFHKPVTVQALSRFERNLRLLWNHRTENFEVHRVTARTRHYWLNGFGQIAYVDDMLVYVCDFGEGLKGSDDPTALIQYLEAGDVRRHPELADDARVEYEIRWQREMMGRKAADEWRHAYRDNRRLLYKAWEPFVNSPTLVR